MTAAPPNWDALRELQAELSARGSALAEQLRPLWQRYAAEAGASGAAPSPEGFLDLLLREQRIDPYTHARYSARAALDLGSPTLRVDVEGRPLQGEALGVAGPLDSHYDVLAPLGEGGMGTVHVARDATLRRRVALKTLHPDQDATALSRFVREAQITAQLDHPYVVPVYALESDEEGVSYAMKLVRGRTLADLVEESEAQLAAGQLDDEHTLDARLDAFLKTCDAVAFAHERGVIHRDLKPANVMIGPFRELYVLDWGLARVMAGEHADQPEVDLEKGGVTKLLADCKQAPEETLAGEIVGTPAYMSPEQAGGELGSVGPASDQFALGLILHELIYLARPYPGVGLLAVLLRAQERDIEPPPRAVHPELAAIVARATALEPAERYASVADLAEDVRRHLRGVETRALPDGPRQRLYRWMRDRQTAVLAGVLALVFLGISALVWTRVAHARALEQREQAIADLSQRTSREAQRLASWLGHFRGQTQELAGATAQALRSPARGEARAYGIADFAAAARRPADSAPSARYKRPISTAEPLAHLAPEAGPEAQADLARLLTLRAAMKSVFQVPVPGGARRAPGLSLEDWIRGDEALVHWVYVASAQGAIVLYPGATSEWPPDYDPTQRTWYQRALKAWRERGEVHAWTPPYRDTMSGALVVSSVHVVLGPEGEVVGTAALDFPIDDLSQQLWADELPGLEQVYLLELTQPPRVLLRRGADTSRVAQGQEVDQERFPFPAGLRQIQAQSAGVLRVDEDRKLVCWQRIASVGFALVGLVDAEAYFSSR